ncbi:MAG TPA: Gfo/Idh/MocA family oxidoreductase, partial [Rheinheimera sp.]|nr:Gfo/Idh/MocA family oxidoreductase [Rheinheimera sp.]
MLLAVIGLGSIGLRHLANLHLLFPHATLLAVSASADNNSIASAALPDYVTAASMSQLLNTKADFVIVASPASLHQQHTEQLLAA